MAPRGSGTCGSLSRVGLGSGRRRARYALEGPFIRSTMRRCGVDEPAGARAGHRQIRQRAHRNERTARYNPGGGAELAKIGKPDSFPITAADHSHLRPVTLSPSKVRTSCATSCPHATALRVTGVSPERTAAQPAPRSARGSRCFDRLREELSPHGTSEQFEQHDDAIAVAELDQHANHVLKGTRGHPHELTEP